MSLFDRVCVSEEESLDEGGVQYRQVVNISKLLKTPDSGRIYRDVERVLGGVLNDTLGAMHGEIAMARKKPESLKTAMYAIDGIERFLISLEKSLPGPLSYVLKQSMKQSKKKEQWDYEPRS